MIKPPFNDKQRAPQSSQKIPETDQEFQSFFHEFLDKLPKPIATTLLKAYDESKALAEKQIAENKGKFESIFSNYLTGVDQPTRKKCHQIIHAASLTAAIVGFSPIPFSDAVLLVPIQMTMMARLHKLFGQSWTASIGKSVSKELVLVSLGRSAVSNVLKFVPTVGTLAGGAINAGVASAITESLGWVTVKMLNDGEDIFEHLMSFKGQVGSLFKLVHPLRKATSK
ncbi:MAG: YcjF family protein [Enterococcus sp.]